MRKNLLSGTAPQKLAGRMAEVDESCMIPIESNGSEQDLEIL
jgi:hypothetical protein